MNLYFKSFFLAIFLFLPLTNLTFAKDASNSKSPNLYVKNSKSLKVRSLKAIVVNQNTGEVIYQKNSDAKASIASLTKLMTAMVVLDSGLDLSKKIKITKADIDRVKRTTSRFPIGTKLSRYELLKAALIFQRSDFIRRMIFHKCEFFRLSFQTTYDTFYLGHCQLLCANVCCDGDRARDNYNYLEAMSSNLN